MAEAFARALANEAHIREPVAWLYRVAFRIASSEMKREARLEEHHELESREDDRPFVVFAVLRQLSPSQRAVAYLHYQADQPVTVVANLLGISSAAVRVHLYRARRRLRELLEESADD